jgi:hypothetical protein
LSQPQHEPVAHVSQKRNPLLQSASVSQDAAHTFPPKRQTCPGGHGSLSSHPPSVVGRQAARQSAHSGQLEVAQPLHTVPGVQLAQKSDSHVGAHVPVEKMQTPPGQSPCWVQPLGPVPTVAVGPGPLLTLGPTLALAPVPEAP